jgi:hypothetical protein
MFCAFRLVFNGTESVDIGFRVLCSRSHFRLYRERRVPFSCFAIPDSFCRGSRDQISHFALPDSFWAVSRASGLVFMFCAPELILGGTEGTECTFHVLHFQTRFGRYQGSRGHFSCLAPSNSFWAVSRTQHAVFMFCAP